MNTRFRRFFGSLHLKIASGVIATIVGISGLFLFVDYRSSERQLIGDLHDSADQLANISLQSLLELAMLGRHPELLQSAVERLGESRSVRRILLMDLSGEVHFSSRQPDLRKAFTKGEEGCRECHSSEKDPLPRSRLIEIQGEQVLRNVTSVPNRRECHVCHAAEQAINGVLVIDFSTQEVHRKLREEFWESSYRAGLMVMSSLIVLGVLINKWVLFPIARLTEATSEFKEGKQTLEPGGNSSNDEIGRLADSFQEMAFRVQASITDLQVQQAYLQELIDGLPDGLIVLDPEGRIEKTNSAADRIWNRDQMEQLLNAGPADSELARALAKTAETRSLVTCQIKLDSEVERSQDDRQAAFLEIYCSPLKDGQGQILSTILLIRDVTLRKLFEMQVSRADRLASVGQLAAGFAHEINNPLAAITTSVEGLNRHVEASDQISNPEKQEIRDYLSVVEQAAMRCKAITQRLLAASAERGTGKEDRVDLADVLNDSVALLQHQAERQGVSVQIVASGATVPPVVSGDREKLSQLVLNLLLNGLEATERGGKIEAVLSQQGGSVRLDINDSGCGIPEDQQERIFDPFWTTKTEGRGTGLGLSICEWIVRQHDARILVRSRVGEGTTFSVVFSAFREGAV